MLKKKAAAADQPSKPKTTKKSVEKKRAGKVVKKAASKSAAAAGPSKQRALAGVEAKAPPTTGGPVTLEEALAMAEVRAPARTIRRGTALAKQATSHESVAKERQQLDDEILAENERRIQEYKATMSIMKARGVQGLAPRRDRRGAAPVAPAGAPAGQPVQIFAEGDSWFEYPVPFFGGGVVPRLQRLLGIPILSLAKAGDEVRNMLGVEERKILIQQFRNGSPAGGPWDALLFSGGGNDIVGNPMALWIRDYDATVPPLNLIFKARYDAALELVRAGYEDLIDLRNTLSPSTQLVFHGYDYVIPDGRGICGMGPWMKPTFDLHRFPTISSAAEVIKNMLQQFADMLQSLASTNRGVTFINTQGTLPAIASSWHNELHPSSTGFDQITQVFRVHLRTLFPGRVL